MKSPFKKSLVIAALLVSFLTAAVRPSYAIFDKTRFATDVGVAFFCFHHWVYKPYKTGAFSAGAPHRTKAIIKGGVALLFALNRLKAANRILQTTKSPLLIRLRGPVNSMTSAFSTIGTKLKHGVFNSGDIDAVNSQVTTVGSNAASAGIKVKDVPIPDPGS